MRLNTRFAALAAVSSLALVGVGCGKSNESSVATTTSTPKPTTVASTPETTMATAASELAVTDVWCRESAKMAGAGGCFMVITGGTEDDALVGVSVSTDVAATAELHETTSDDATTDSSMSGGHETSTSMGSGGGNSHGAVDGASGDDAGSSGMMHMRKVNEIPVPAGGKTELAPGGYHVMLMDLATPLEPGNSIEMTLTFKVAGEIQVNAEVRPL